MPDSNPDVKTATKRTPVIAAFCCIASIVVVWSSCTHSAKTAGTTKQLAVVSSASSAVRTNADMDSAPFREWVKGTWDTNSFDSGLRFAAEGDARRRALALEKLFSKRDSLSAEQLQEFRRTLEQQIRATSDHPHVVASSIRMLAGILDYLKSRGLVSEAEIASDGELLVNYMRDNALDLQVRGAALRACGDLGITSGRASIEALLVDPATANTAEIARNGCLALVKLANEEAFAPVRTVFEKTSESAIFGTAAYCLGQINTPEAMSTLVDNSHRFPDSASCDAVLVNMERVILEALKHPERPEVLDAIRATEHLWKDGQREKYIAALRELLASGPLAVRKASCERLIEAASRLPFAQEKQELSVVLDSIGQSAELAEYTGKIRQRVQATVLSPVVDPSSVPAQKKE